MARVITPSGDEVRTVYSSGGFAAGDYVFQTASGFEKAAGAVPWPIKANSVMRGSSLSSLGFGFQPAVDYLLGPSQTGGIYTGSAISFGDNRYANTSTALSNGYLTAAQLSTGNYVVVYDTSTNTKVRVYSSDFTTLLASFVVGTGAPSFNQYYKLYPDGAGGCVLAGINPSNHFVVGYLANTSGNNYSISPFSSFNQNVVTGWINSPGCGVLAMDGVAYFGGRNDSYGSNFAWLGKYVYSPGSAAGGALYTTTLDYSPSAVRSVTWAIPTTAFGATYAYPSMIISWANGNSFALAYDTNGLNSGAANFAGSWAGVGTSSIYLGIGTVISGGSYGAFVFPMIDSMTDLKLQVFYIDSSGAVTSAGPITTGAITLASSATDTVGARASLGITSSSSLLSSNPDLAVYYARTNGTYDIPYARQITGALTVGVTPTSSAEVLLNSSTPTASIINAIAYFNQRSGLLQGNVRAATNTLQGSAAGSLSTPQPFAYGSSLTPGQTGACVGVALTAASAGGTGKILVRGTAEVRSTLPNMPGALSFNHANYGTPGGVRGSVAGRTVTFEGIDG